MPFASKAQERWAFATKQPFAKEFAANTDQARLPSRKSSKSSARRSTRRGRR